MLHEPMLYVRGERRDFVAFVVAMCPILTASEPRITFVFSYFFFPKPFGILHVLLGMHMPCHQLTLNCRQQR